MNELAPIILFVYNRPDHTHKTLEALKKNELAEQSELYIYSDAAKNELQLDSVKKVREIIHGIDGFKKVTIIAAEKNKGLAKSVITGVTDVINKYGKVIVLEDDLTTSNHFLKYMNESLELYRDNNKIWSISGYTPNISFPQEYEQDVYLSVRGSSWGWATWQDRWNSIDWDVKDYIEFRDNKHKRKEFNNGGNDLSFMLEDQMTGRIDSWAIRWVYNQYKQSKFTIYPTKSLLNNIGLDFSGTHSSNTDKYSVQIYKGTINLPTTLDENHEIIKEFKSFYDLNFKGYLGVVSRRLGIYKQARKIQKLLSR